MIILKRIELTRGMFALVDDEDFDWLNRFNWTYGTPGYAYRHKKIRGKIKVIYMHRFILEHHGYNLNGFVTDHINRNKLDNRKINLRVATYSQNHANIDKYGNKSSKYKGVCWDKSRNKWIVHIQINQKQAYIGRFDNEEDAAKAYNKRALELFGEYARINEDI